MSDLKNLERLQRLVTVRHPYVDPEYHRDRRHLLFVYGTMKQGHRNHDRLELRNAEFLGRTETRAAMFRLHVRDTLAGYRAPIAVGGRYRIRGELYEVDGTALSMIDACEGHPWAYERRPVKVVLLDQPVWYYHWMGTSLGCTEVFADDDGVVEYEE